jgi:BolA family transcriptional regulator, general stress-responsive regulator
MAELWVRKCKRQENVLLDFPPAREKFADMTVAARIREKLTAAFAPALLDVQDESARHAGHAGATRDDGSRGETHFHVRLVSAAFEGVPRVERQRRIYAALKEELAGPVHALSLAALTPSEAQKP